MEKKISAVLGYPLKATALLQLRCNKLSVIKLINVDARKPLKREDIDVVLLLSLGQKTLQQATLEAERRFCRNETKQIIGAPLHMTEREKLSTLLDLHTGLYTTSQT